MPTVPVQILNNGAKASDWFIVGLTFGLLVTAAWQVVLFCRQTKLFHSQTRLLARQERILRVSNDLARNDQRAWLGPTTPKTDWDTFPPGVTAILRNLGHGPALEVQHNIRLAFLLPPQYLTLEVIEAELAKTGYVLPASSAAIMPGDEYETGALFEADPWTPETRVAIQHQELFVYVFGRVRYKGIFGDCHTTTFGRYQHPLIDKAWAYTSIFNDMT